MSTGSRCCWPSAYRSRTPTAKEGINSGQDLSRREAAATPEVRGAELHALQQVRPPARRVQEVRALSHLPARARAPGRHSRHDEVQLVGEDMNVGLTEFIKSGAAGSAGVGAETPC